MAAIVAAPSGATRAPAMGYPAAMNDDQVNARIDEAVLALLYLGIFERHPVMGARTWKSFDWAAIDRLHDKGLISDPVSKAKSVTFTEPDGDGGHDLRGGGQPGAERVDRAQRDRGNGRLPPHRDTDPRRCRQRGGGVREPARSHGGRGRYPEQVTKGILATFGIYETDIHDLEGTADELANAYLDNGWKQSERSEFGNRIRGIESKGRAAVRAEKRNRTFEPLDETIGRLGRVWSLLIAWLEMFAKLYPEAGKEVAGVTRRVDRCLSGIDEDSEKYGASPELIEHVQRTRAEARQLWGRNSRSNEAPRPGGRGRCPPAAPGYGRNANCEPPRVFRRR